MAVTDIDGVVQFVDGQGVRRQVPIQVTQRVAAGKSVKVRTGIGPVTSRATLQSVRAGIVKARIAE